MTLTFLENQKFSVVFGGYKYGGLGDNGLLSIVEWYSDRKSAVWVWIKCWSDENNWILEITLGLTRGLKRYLNMNSANYDFLKSFPCLSISLYYLLK